jgi:hypothetical protein
MQVTGVRLSTIVRKFKKLCKSPVRDCHQKTSMQGMGSQDTALRATVRITEMMIPLMAVK